MGKRTRCPGCKQVVVLRPQLVAAAVSRAPVRPDPTPPPCVAVPEAPPPAPSPDLPGKMYKPLLLLAGAAIVVGLFLPWFSIGARSWTGMDKWGKGAQPGIILIAVFGLMTLFPLAGSVFRLRFGRGLAVPTFLLAALGVVVAILAVHAQGFKELDHLQHMGYGFFLSMGTAAVAVPLSLLAAVRPQRKKNPSP